MFKKQTGGRGKFADIIVNVGPLDPDFKDGNLQFVNKVTGGNIPKEFIPSVQKGFESAMKNGVLGGYPMVGLKVELLDGSFHPVDSDQLSFEVAAINAYKNACSKAGPALMEPIMRLEVVCPEENIWLRYNPPYHYFRTCYIFDAIRSPRSGINFYSRKSA